MLVFGEGADNVEGWRHKMLSLGIHVEHEPTAFVVLLEQREDSVWMHQLVKAIRSPSVLLPVSQSIHSNHGAFPVQIRVATAECFLRLGCGSVRLPIGLGVACPILPQRENGSAACDQLGQAGM